MIKHIWLYPPMAFARVGGSSTPCENFYWGPDDLTPKGTARTRIVPAETLVVADDGSVAARRPSDQVTFRDSEGLRPVCPFFELHGAWEENGKTLEGPITPAVLERLGLSAAAPRWQVEVFNLKAFHLTRSPGDRIEASVSIPAGRHDRQHLEGRSPQDGQPLVPHGASIRLGSVQATRPTAKLPEFRLRFTPPAGKVFAPSDIAQRLAALSTPAAPNDAAAAVEALAKGIPLDKILGDYLPFNLFWKTFALPPEQCLLNPQAAWPSHRLVGLNDVLARLAEFLPRFGELDALLGPGDRSEVIRAFRGPRTDVGSIPPSIFAFAVESPEASNIALASVGMVDDTGDGTISVELGGLTATARVVIAPPSYAPDRRLPISIADGLADRVKRDEVRDPRWVSGKNRRLADDEVADILDRAYETVGLQNVDAVVDYFRRENSQMARHPTSPLTPQQAEGLMWDADRLLEVEAMPMVARALQRHRRNTARIFFEIFNHETRGWFEKWVRPPAEAGRFYDKRMPALMCGFDRRPLHLSRRQYELLKAWSKQEPKP